jgi:hypothetical protein
MNKNTHSAFSHTFIVMSWLKWDSVSKTFDLEDSGLGSSTDNESICNIFPSVDISRRLWMRVVRYRLSWIRGMSLELDSHLAGA